MRVRGCLNLYDAIQTGVFHCPVAVRRLLRTGTSGTLRRVVAALHPLNGCRSTTSHLDGAGSGPARCASQDIATRMLERAGLERAAGGGRGACCLSVVVRCVRQRAHRHGGLRRRGRGRVVSWWLLGAGRPGGSEHLGGESKGGHDGRGEAVSARAGALRRRALGWVLCSGQSR